MSATVKDRQPTIDTELIGRSHVLRSRAGDLRSTADTIDTRTTDLVLADTYRRRASELDLEAWVAELQSGMPYGEVQPIAA